MNKYSFLDSTNDWLVVFCIDVTFEMKTVLYRSSLLIDHMKMSDRVFISKRD